MAALPLKQLLLAALALSTSCAASSDFETIRSVPVYVLTVDDLVARVHRSPRELGVRTEGVQVVGVLVRRGQPCNVATFNPGTQPDPCSGPETANVFSTTKERQPPYISVLLNGADARVVEGETYVLAGSVEMAPNMPERWALRAQVLAHVVE